MPIADIINEIDAYLARLCEARKLLSDRMTGAPQKKVLPGKGKVMVRHADRAFSGGRQADENKSRSNHPVPHLKKVTKRVDISAQVPSVVADRASDAEQPAIAKSDRTIPQSVVIENLPAKGPSTSIRSVRHRIAKPTLSTNHRDKVKPAIALAGPMNTKIVVVSADQVERERKQAAHPAIRRHLQPASGLGGRLAFEALFKDDTDPSTGGQ